ncbi:MAG: TraR/DksA C4-type zinc finger protein [Billgrantia sp.]
MADTVDIASEIMERRLEGALANCQRPIYHQVVNDPECEDRGGEIPADRRQAAPWATTCIECQGIRERRARHVR